MNNYELPTTISNQTVHFDHKQENSIKEYIDKNNFALTADLLKAGYQISEIENLVNSGDATAAPWPQTVRHTDVYWSNSNEAKKTLDELAEKTAYYVDDETPKSVNFGTLVSVGAKMDDQGKALIGLTYAREKGLIQEVSFSNTHNEETTMYVRPNSFAALFLVDYTNMFLDSVRMNRGL